MDPLEAIRARTDAARFDPFYADREGPPWEIGRPQPAVVALADAGKFTGRVLDVGCGTGENTLYLASRGHTVLGVDGAPTAIEHARANARERGLAAEFIVADAFDLTALGRSFDTVLDSAFMHIPGNTAARRRAYTDQLAAVLSAGGWVHLLEISERVTGYPSLSTAEIIDAFDDSWTEATIQETTYAITTEEVPAWLVSIQRLGPHSAVPRPGGCSG
jgi:SAM-dependent methyltransferase